MWLFTTFCAAIIATFLYLKSDKKYKFDFLALMLWGATIMILTDHILGYEGGEFLEKSTDGIITNSTSLGLLMILPVISSWIVAIIASNQKNKHIL